MISDQMVIIDYIYILVFDKISHLYEFRYFGYYNFIRHVLNKIYTL